MIQTQLQLETKPKLSPKQQEILDLFRSMRASDGNRYVSNLMLNKICFRYGGRIMELRRKGYKIRTGKTDKYGIVIYKLEP